MFNVIQHAFRIYTIVAQAKTAASRVSPGGKRITREEGDALIGAALFEVRAVLRDVVQPDGL